MFVALLAIVVAFEAIMMKIFLLLPLGMTFLGCLLNLLPHLLVVCVSDRKNSRSIPTDHRDGVTQSDHSLAERSLFDQFEVQAHADRGKKRFPAPTTTGKRTSATRFNELGVERVPGELRTAERDDVRWRRP